MSRGLSQLPLRAPRLCGRTNPSQNFPPAETQRRGVGLPPASLRARPRFTAGPRPGSGFKTKGAKGAKGAMSGGSLPTPSACSAPLRENESLSDLSPAETQRRGVGLPPASLRTRPRFTARPRPGSGFTTKGAKSTPRSFGVLTSGDSAGSAPPRENESRSDSSPAETQRRGVRLPPASLRARPRFTARPRPGSGFTTKVAKRTPCRFGVLTSGDSAGSAPPRENPSRLHRYANSFETTSPWTSVSRKSRPWKR
jgi:hypothetical protein